MPFGSARVFLVYYSISFESTPVWCDVFSAFLPLFLSSAGCNRCKNGGAYWAANSCSMFFGSRPANIVKTFLVKETRFSFTVRLASYRLSPLLSFPCQNPKKKEFFFYHTLTCVWFATYMGITATTDCEVWVSIL